MIPARMKAWLIIWTPILWVVLTLIWYPKDRSVSQGVGRVLGGFVDSEIAAYPAWVLLVTGVTACAWGLWKLVRDERQRRLGAVGAAMGGALVVWGVVAGWGSESGWSVGAHAASCGWLFQTVVIALLGATAWAWGDANPERAELTVWNLRQLWRLFRSNWQGIFGLVVLVFFILMALLAPFLAAHTYLDPNAQIGQPFASPEWSYYKILGLDEQGLSVWAEYVWSARISLVVGLLATAISTVLGALIGVGAGFYGGWSGEFWMRTTDVFLVLPWLPFAMVLAAAWGQSYGMIVLIIGITSWPGTARIVRAETLKIRRLQFIERAKAIGSANTHTMARHILPNVFPLIFANTVLVVAIAILAETTLSFLGLGDPLNFSWGTMLRNAWLSGAAGLPEWAYLISPGASIVLVVLGFTFVGQALDTVLDPKLRRREQAGQRPACAGDGGEALQDAPESVLQVGEAEGMLIPEQLGLGAARTRKVRRGPRPSDQEDIQ